ncbi:MAG TPA: D-alanyl-D-alanine carboxypeptidase/D-alanyl-D-alanine-endopeptidase [Candidatus Acidoferrales bacterium]
MAYNHSLKKSQRIEMPAISNRSSQNRRSRFIISVIAAATLIPVTGAVHARTRAASPSRPAAQSGGVSQFISRVNAALAEAHAQKAFWGILVADRDTGKELYELNADHFFAPASNAKLFATSLALATLGPDHRYRTTLESKSALSSDGRLAGDLILVGRGDPDLSNREFPFDPKAERDGAPEKVLAELADAAVAKGLKEVDGDIVGDDTYYPYDPYPAGWVSGDLFFSFGAPVTAIDYNDNTIGIDVLPGVNADDPVSLAVQPAAAHDGFESQITTAAVGTKADLAVVRQPEPNFILLRGTVPAGGPAVHLELAMTQPAETAGQSLKELLEARGVVVHGAVHVLHSPPPVVDATGNPGPPESPIASETDRVVLAEHMSPPLIQSIQLTNKISQNLHAEMFLREVGRTDFGTGSTAAGLSVERNFLHTIGIADGDVVLADGSGLSPQDLVTPRAVVTLLLYDKSQPWGADFLSTLPIAGVDGTLEHRFNSGPATGLIHAKTGSIANVRAISGYATSARGESLVFSIFANNNPQHGLDATVTMDAIAAAMVDCLGPDPRSAKHSTRGARHSSPAPAH